MVRPLPDEARGAVEKIVRDYGPERVVLFGSYAYGEPTADSDVDLLVVKATSERPFDRALKVRRLLRGTERRVPIEFIILTPDELDERIAAGDPFLSMVLRRGVVLHAA